MSGSKHHHVHEDITPRANGIIWLNFIIFVVVLFGTIGALVVYFKETLQEERFIKVDSVSPKELKALRAEEVEILEGRRAVEEGKASISIEAAMDGYIAYVRAGNKG